MLYRIPFLAGVTMALVAMAGLPLMAADEKMHEATVVTIAGGKITLSAKGSDEKHAHDVAKDAKITLDGKEAKLQELKAGFPVKVMMDDKSVVTIIEAQSKKP